MSKFKGIRAIKKRDCRIALEKIKIESIVVVDVSFLYSCMFSTKKADFIKIALFDTNLGHILS